jgi:hypothetical protein
MSFVATHLGSDGGGPADRQVEFPGVNVPNSRVHLLQVGQSMSTAEAGRFLAALMFIAAVGVAQPCIAAETELAVSTGLSYSTNIEKRDGGQAETAAVLGVDGKVERTGTWSRISATADVVYFSYLEGVFEDELLGRADAQADIFIVGERIKWVTTGSFGQIQVDPTLAVTPDNREDVRYLATGPDLRFQIGRNGFALLTGRFSQAAYEISELDGSRVATSVEVGRELSQGNKISLNAALDSLKFDQSVDFPDYDRTSAYVTYEGKGSRTRVAITAGVVNVDAPGDQQTNPLLEVGVTRDLTRSTSVSAFVGTRLTDATDSFRALAPVGAPPGANSGVNALTAATFRRDDVELQWRFSRSRTDLAVSVYWTEDTFSQNSNFDVERWDVRGTFKRQLMPSLSAELLLSFNEGTYRNFPLQDRGWLVSAEFDFRLARKLSLVTRLEFEERTAAISFSDERLILLARYSPTN